MRLLQSVLPTLRQTKKPQQQFLAHLLGLLLRLPGPATFRNLSRYRASHARTFARWYARAFAFVSLNKAAILHVIPPDHAQALVLDASFVPKSGKLTSGLDRFWHGSQSRTAKGVAISTLAWLDLTDHGAYGLHAAQTPPAGKPTAAEATRRDVSLDQWARVVSEHHLRHLRDVMTDGYDSKPPCLRGVRALGLEHIGTLRRDANRRALYQGPQRPGPGRPTTYDGKVDWDHLSQLAKVDTEDDAIVLSHQVRNPVQCRRHLRVWLVVDTKHHRKAVRFRTDLNVDALPLYRYDKACFPSEFLCRDAQQCTGLTDCQARSHATRHLHFQASLSAVTLAKRDARQPNGETGAAFSMASLQRRAFNQHLIERIAQY